jgi:hypothetical protein
MSAANSAEQTQLKGPSGFIEYRGQMLVVDYGRIYLESESYGFLCEDGFLKETSPFFGTKERKQSLWIDELPGCIFRGIDTGGLALELPAATPGPSGDLVYNNLPFDVVNGRIVTKDHRYIGDLDDAGRIYVRVSDSPDFRRTVDEYAQLHTTFVGENAQGEEWEFEYARPLNRRDKSYVDNEIIRYFEDFDKLAGPQKKYVLESLHLWSACGLLQVVRKSEGNCMLGNIKHGAAGVTAVRTGYVTLDRTEFEKEIELFRRFGTLAVMTSPHKPYLEVRVNLVVAHEFGHQVEFCLSQATQERIREMYEERLKNCNHVHPRPRGYEGYCELLEPQQVAQRFFMSGYARSSHHEYWAECVAAFSIKEGREKLKACDKPIHDLLAELVLKPQNLVSRVVSDSIMSLQSSLHLGGEFNQDLLQH